MYVFYTWISVPGHLKNVDSNNSNKKKWCDYYSAVQNLMIVFVQRSFFLQHEQIILSWLRIVCAMYAGLNWDKKFIAMHNRSYMSSFDVFFGLWVQNVATTYPAFYFKYWNFTHLEYRDDALKRTTILLRYAPPIWTNTRFKWLTCQHSYHKVFFSDVWIALP